MANLNCLLSESRAPCAVSIRTADRKGGKPNSGFPLSRSLSLSRIETIADGAPPSPATALPCRPSSPFSPPVVPGHPPEQKKSLSFTVFSHLSDMVDLSD
jgi:hypothetical protein